MPRSPRVFFEGATYHVYNRLARGERVFGEDEFAALLFVKVLLEVVKRDDLVVLAWCLMSNHYHLAVQTGKVGVHRPLKSLQQRVANGVNARRSVHGPLWQGRYRAKLVKKQEYLDCLVAYIHLNPVAAGVVRDPARYRWSGHREILGMVEDPIIDADKVLRMFGGDPRSARAEYLEGLKSGRQEKWIGEEPGHLPWWRLGRPPAGEAREPGESAPETTTEAEDREAVNRPLLGVEEFLRHGVGALGTTMEELRSPLRSPELVQARRLLFAVGMQRYGLRGVDLADRLNKSAQTAWNAAGWIARMQSESEEVREAMERLDGAIAKKVPGT